MSGRHTIIRGGLVLDASGGAAAKDILIQDGLILAIEAPGFGVSDDAEVLSAADRMLIPGLVNAHTHSHGALNRGAVDDKVSLEMFLTGAGSSTRSRGIDDKYLSAALSAAEMIRKGCTACFDLTVEFPGPTREGISAVARAYRDSGMRAVVAPMIADRTIYQALPGLLEALPDEVRAQVADMRTAPIDQTFSVCEEILANWEFDRRLIRPALGPTIWQTSTAYRYRPIWRNRVRKAPSDKPDTAGAWSDISITSAFSPNASARRMRSGSTTMTQHGWDRPASGSHIIRRAIFGWDRAWRRYARC